MLFKRALHSKAFQRNKFASHSAFQSTLLFLHLYIAPKYISHSTSKSICNRNIHNIMESKIDNNASNNALFGKDQFKWTIPLISLKIPANECKNYMIQFKNFMFKKSKMKSIYNVTNEPSLRHFLLNEKIQSLDLSELPLDLYEFNKLHNGIPERYNLELGYDHLTVEEILRKLLPEQIVEIPSSFEQVGHVAHINLRDEVLQYKYIIGQVIMDKNPTITTVVNKLSSIETEFRTFPMELIAGENNMDVCVRESGAKFYFNFSEVYWNSRLATEHDRLVKIIAESSPLTGKKVVVADLMCGVGPFAIPLALTEKCIIHANDLNPASFKYLLLNKQKNQLWNDAELNCYNMDGRIFVNHLISIGQSFDHAIMNLPSIALEFLDVFIGYGFRVKRQAQGKENESKIDNEYNMTPLIHVYCFSNAENPALDVITRAAAILDCGISEFGTAEQFVFCNNLAPSVTSSFEKPTKIYAVRDVAPKKIMICLSFRLPLNVSMRDNDDLFSKHTSDRVEKAVEEEDSSSPKRRKFE